MACCLQPEGKTKGAISSLPLLASIARDDHKYEHEYGIKDDQDRRSSAPPWIGMDGWMSASFSLGEKELDSVEFASWPNRKHREPDPESCRSRSRKNPKPDLPHVSGASPAGAAARR
ncbi:hypothetical protein MA16_Dca010790 [Dendrobium catenatum]|uniref:Uncharacterized protein n=1 Tax=Dendrobium catenatum TaxID=906689 RepID=A0A2I0W577_9ASPA|nr:hypothetical protein MA16_Dca010790 [Dendrobium catenatum]